RPSGILTGRMEGEHRLAVVAQMKADIEARQRQTLDDFLQMVELGLFAAQELAPRRSIEEQVAHFHRSADRVRRRLHPCLHVPTLGFYLPGFGRLAVREVRVRRDTELIEASASPRNPRLITRSRSSRSR